MPFTNLGPQHLADPTLWTPAPSQVLDGARSLLNVRYAIHVGWRPLGLDLHLPAEGTGPSPIVVYADGGSFIGGVKEMGPWATLTAEGIAVASIEYRLADEASWPERVEDVRAAIRWVRSHGVGLGLDVDRVAAGCAFVRHRGLRTLEGLIRGPKNGPNNPKNGHDSVTTRHVGSDCLNGSLTCANAVRGCREQTPPDASQTF